jgi:hypothetical protein
MKMESDRLRECLAAHRADDVDQGLSEVEALELRELLADDPELAAELLRLQGWDNAIAGAMENVEVPVGLSSRLLAAVDQELVQPVVAVAPKSTRRTWLIALVGTAAALLLAVGVGSYLAQPQVIDVAALDQEARELTADLEPLAWQTDPESFPREVFPDDVRVSPQRWTHVATSLDRQAIMFDLVRAGAPRAVVIAMKTKAASSELPARPEDELPTSTGNLRVGAWRQDDYLYVLVVSGSRARYRLFLRDPAPLTLNWPAPVLSH